MREALMAHARDVLTRYPDPNSAMLPLLYLVQEADGWVSPAGLEEVASFLGVAPAVAESVASFYTLLQKRPVGRYVLQVCTNLSCSLLGAEHLLDHLGRKLGIGPGETTPDGLFTLQSVECLAECGQAPVLQVNLDFHSGLTPEKVDALLDALRKEAAKDV